ncbi:MAG TPA: COX15/CtaA family protein, partial [Deinococcales bacterium]|nr:COX15/CtaA family protein [Deinococcales bacterium]
MQSSLPVPPVALPRLRGFLSPYAWGVLGFNLLVVVWGAYVRATGSGAGCGDHWPTCNGAVVPASPAVQTLIEFTHRASTGLLTALVAGLVLLAWRSRPRGDPTRTFSALAALFLVTEALLGAGLVLFGLVADNATPERAV